ncbi:hypothetical protein SAMN05444411_11129 [Lutibacter oricola]|uniref:LTXXQ motif family protein n=1 Tax=Lutibacter oricola TaxID=762486 RepID=A0A1H3FEZ7_9FLAO|nr:hypothetical protein [Lutibacter oricola]SDX89536.1 hypothetical protein SAMN05444411_11129 [Lutibacter oricola]
MKHIKLLVSLLFVVTISFSTVAQDKSAMAAAKGLEKLKKEIVTGDASVALSKKQEKEFTAAFVKNLKAIKEVKKTVTDKTEKQAQIKELYRTFSIKLKQEILTKAQNVARQKGKKILKK